MDDAANQAGSAAPAANPSSPTTPDGEPAGPPPLTTDSDHQSPGPEGEDGGSGSGGGSGGGGTDAREATPASACEDAGATDNDGGDGGPRPPPRIIAKFLLSNAAAGSVIGRNGATINELQAASGARLQLSRCVVFSFARAPKERAFS